MSRDLDASLSTALPNANTLPVVLAILTFRTATEYVWTGVGDLVFNGNTYKGVGNVGSVGTISEGVTLKADGTTITLSGIDPVLLNESLTDIQQGAPASIYFGLLTDNVVLIGNPYRAFQGVMDAPTVGIGADTISITIALENAMLDGQRASMLRYTDADQRRLFPTDSAFKWVPQLNDLNLRWGTNA